MIWYFNDLDGNFSIDELPVDEEGNPISGWRVIAERPVPHDDYVFDGDVWVKKVVREKTREELKAERDLAVASIVVTTSTGKQFNGDETSQTRMARAIIAMQAANAQTITWVLATNDAVEVTVAELSEALVLAGQAQSAVWVIR
jgi:hypothetical protein